MTNIEIKSFDKPDETRPFEGKGYADVVTLGGRPVARAVFEAGWRWSVNVKPIAGTESCQTHHVGYCLGGRMRVVMDDGFTREFGPGDVMDIPPGHDAETLGDEACVMLDFGEISRYAKPT
jgi:hypothetical protein